MSYFADLTIFGIKVTHLPSTGPVIYTSAVDSEQFTGNIKVFKDELYHRNCPLASAKEWIKLLLVSTRPNWQLTKNMIMMHG